MIEFQSTVDKLMPLRIDAYKSQLRLRLAELSGLPVPQIVPFVLYSGDRGWDVSTTIEPLQAKPLPGLEKESYYLVDLNDPRWASDPVNNAFKLAAKFNQCKSVPELHAKLAEHAEWLNDRPVEPSLVYWLYNVRQIILKDGPIDDDDLQPLLRNLDTRELKMTLIKQLTEDVQRIREESREEGFRDGEAYGEARGKASTLVKIMLEKYGAIPESLRTMIHETTDVARLDEMLDLTFSSETLEKFEEQLK